MSDELARWLTMVAVWGWAVSGRPENSADAAEGRNSETHPQLWDHPSWLTEGYLVDPGGAVRAFPDRFALPWVTEHLMRQEMAAVL